MSSILFSSEQAIRTVPQDGFWQNPLVPDHGIWDQDRFISYSELWKLGDAVVDSAGLQQRGLALLFVDNSALSIAAYLGFLRAGHGVFLGDHRDSIDKQLSWIREYQPEVVWGAKSQGQLDSEYHQCKFQNTDMLLCHPNGSETLHPELGLLLATSGSTGDPKVARISYSALQANALSIAKVLDLDAQERPVTSLHMSFSYGLSVINSHLACGASIACTNASVQDDDFWKVADRHACTSFAGVPFQYKLLRELDYWEDPSPTIKTYTQAGGALASEQQEFHSQNALKSGARFIVMYGQTEATARISVLPPDELNSHFGSIGFPIPDGKLSIRNPDPETGEGELVYEGTNVMMGYASSRKSLGKGDELSGVLHTGDLAKVDEDGYFYIVGRLKRIIKPFGIRVSLDHLEQLAAQWIGLDTAVVGNDSMVTLLIEGDQSSTTGIAERISKQIGIPEPWVKVASVEKIPRDRRNKIDYGEVEHILAALPPETREHDESEENVPDLQDQILRIWSHILNIKNIRANDNVFLDHGADSITAVSAMIEIESLTSQELDLGDLFRNPSVIQQVQFLSRTDDGLSTGSEGDSLRTIVSHATSNQLLLFSASTGHEWMYLHLARSIAGELGIQVLRDWRLNEGHYVPQTIANLAEWCVDRLSQETSIPPILGGYSFGGLLAYEVAIRLEQAGRPPKGIVLIDALYRPMLVRWIRNWVVKLLWHNAQRNNPLWHIPLIKKLFRPDEAAVRLLLSLSNRQANYTTRPIGPMAEYVLGSGSGIDPTRPIEQAFSELSKQMQEQADPEMVRRFVLPGVRPETALEHLLVFATNIMLNNAYIPSAPTKVPILFITPRQTPAHKIWRSYAQGQFDPYIVDGIRSEGYLNAHTNMVEPESVLTYRDELIRWVQEISSKSKS